jgi:hypothetical protein
MASDRAAAAAPEAFFGLNHIRRRELAEALEDLARR